MGESDQLRFFGCIDRPGPVAVAGSKISVRGWVAAPAPVCEVSLSINDIGVGITRKPQVRDLKNLGYPEANVFSYEFSDLSLPHTIDSKVSVAIAAKLANGQTFRSAKTLRIVDTIEDAVRLLCISSGEFPSDLFDHEWYVGAYSDIKLPREAHLESIQHYLNFGAQEHRDPNPLFDSKWYAQRFNLPTDVDPLAHYAQHEKDGQVSPNPFWESVSRSSMTSPPPLSRLLGHYPRLRKPTYIVGLYGTGRSYINSLIMNSGLDIAYYFRNGLYQYFGTVPAIFSGHTNLIYEGGVFLEHPASFGRALLDRAAARLINLIFIYRHPLESLLTNWVWFRHFHQFKKMTSGIEDVYKSKEDFHRDLNDNIYEFSLFCGGSKDFGRITAGKEVTLTFLSLLEFIDETEAFIGNPNVHCFRFEEFGSNAVGEVTRLISIMAPDLTPKFDNVTVPRSLPGRYESSKENSPSFRALMKTLPTEIAKRIIAMGYSV
jgi:hypothetical protein